MNSQFLEIFSFRENSYNKKNNPDHKAILYSDLELAIKLDFPSHIYDNGDMTWYHHRIHHRLKGPAIIQWQNKRWFHNGILFGYDTDGYDQKQFERDVSFLVFK